MNMTIVSPARPGSPRTSSTFSRLIETATKTSPAKTAAAPAAATPNSNHAWGSYALTDSSDTVGNGDLEGVDERAGRQVQADEQDQVDRSSVAEHFGGA